VSGPGHPGQCRAAGSGSTQDRVGSH